MFGLFFMSVLALGFVGDASNKGAIDLNDFPPAIHAEKFTVEYTYPESR